MFTKCCANMMYDNFLQNVHTVKDDVTFNKEDDEILVKKLDQSLNIFLTIRPHQPTPPHPTPQ